MVSHHCNVSQFTVLRGEPLGQSPQEDVWVASLLCQVVLEQSQADPHLVLTVLSLP